MGWSYVHDYITDAINKYGDNPNQLKKHLATRIVEDPRFLIELTKPHIDGILSHAVDRVIKKNATDDSQPHRQADATSDTMKLKDQDLAQELVRILGDNSAADHAKPEFGREGEFAKLPKKPASQAHIDAIKAISKKTSS